VIIVALLVLPLSLVRHRQAKLAINDKQILFLLSACSCHQMNKNTLALCVDLCTISSGLQELALLHLPKILLVPA
jgi:hypothetical protein